MEKKENNSLKIIILGAIALIIVISLAIIVVKKNSEMLVQGEVDSKDVDVSAKVVGRIKHLYVKKGDMVREGQILVQLDTPDIAAKAEQADATLSLAGAQQEEVNNGARKEQISAAYSQLQQALAGQELARKTYTRMKRLNTEGVIPTQKLDESSAQYKSATKAADAARSAYNLYASGSRYEDKEMAGANVRKARGAVAEVNSYLRENRLKAPNKGQITDIPVEEGELVAAGFPIMTIVDLSDVWVTFNVREDMLTKLPMGKIFEVTIPALGKKPVKVRVNYISAMGNFATWRATKIKGDFDMKTFEVRAVPVKPVNGLRAGMSAVFDWNKLK